MENYTGNWQFPNFLLPFTSDENNPDSWNLKKIMKFWKVINHEKITEFESWSWKTIMEVFLGISIFESYFIGR